MVGKIFKILIIAFIVVPWTVIGLIAFILSILCFDPFGIFIGAIILFAQFLTVKGLLHKHIATAETPKEQIVETPQPANNPIPTFTTEVVFCSRCGGPMDTSCKYCRDCGAPLKLKEE